MSAFVVAYLVIVAAGSPDSSPDGSQSTKPSSSPCFLLGSLIVVSSIHLGPASQA